MNKRLSMWLGGKCQRLAWRLCDPHDNWMVDYRIDGKPHSEIVHGHFRMARAKARELKGVVSGWSATVVRPDDGSVHA